MKKLVVFKKSNREVVLIHQRSDGVPNIKDASLQNDLRVEDCDSITVDNSLPVELGMIVFKNGKIDFTDERREKRKIDQLISRKMRKIEEEKSKQLRELAIKELKAEGKL
jgi:uncharacterized protein involved in outer membrane biogenesis